MAGKPRTKAGYGPQSTELVRSACLHLATRLGDLLDDLVIVGGLVPSLIVDQETLELTDKHPGTTDLDLGLSLAILDTKRYDTLVERLQAAGFQPDAKPSGTRSHFRWCLADAPKLKLDFLIPTPKTGERAGSQKHLATDFAAIVATGLHLAFRDRIQVTIDGVTPARARAKRAIWVSGPGAFVVMKAHAFRNRGEPKDAYDLFYLLRYFGRSVNDVAAALAPLLDDSEAAEATRFLAEDFAGMDSLGPVAVAEFQTGTHDAPAIQADAVGFVADLLRECAQLRAEA